MPKVNNVGYGEYTTKKMEILRSIFGMHLAITQAVLNKRRSYKQIYKYIDATAGKGYVPESLVLGSPLTFLNVVHSQKFYKSFEVDLIEQEEINFRELQGNVRKFCKKNQWDEGSFLQYFHGNYEQVLPAILGKKEDRELGLIFIDHSGELPNFDAINLISRLRPRMEILLYISARNIKRLHHITNKSLLDYMQEVSKNYWLIRKPDKWDRLEWTFLLGSNTDIFQNYKKIDFFRLESDEAQRFFPKVNLTSKERMEEIQPKLFDLD